MVGVPSLLCAVEFRDIMFKIVDNSGVQLLLGRLLVILIFCYRCLVLRLVIYLSNDLISLFCYLV